MNFAVAGKSACSRTSRRPRSGSTGRRRWTRPRHACGNDTPYRGKPARTFKHFVLSPDPQDGLSTGQVAELAGAWALKHFADFEVAIVLHDDNESRIPHAHIVVNNTNLVTERRLQTPDPLELNRSLQELAEERGYRFMRDEAREGRRRGAGAQGGAHDAAARLPPTSRKGNRARRRLLVGGGHQKPSHGGQGARPKRGRVHGRARSARS